MALQEAAAVKVWRAGAVCTSARCQTCGLTAHSACDAVRNRHEYQFNIDSVPGCAQRNAAMRNRPVWDGWPGFSVSNSTAHVQKSIALVGKMNIHPAVT